MLRIEVRELQFLTAVAENRGFKRAAEQLAISQSAISQGITGLEAKLNQRLFQRSPFALTEAGERLLLYAQSRAHEELLVLQDLDDIRRGEQSKLSLAVNGSINRYHAPELVLEFCRNNPNARLQLEELPSRQVLQAVVNGGAELGIGPFQRQMPALNSVPLFEEVRTLVVAKSHHMIEQLRSKPEAALANLPLRASYLDDPEERPGTQKIRDYFKGVWEVRSISLRLHLLAQGHAIGFIGDQILVQEALCQDLEEVRGLPFSRIRRSVGLVMRRDSTLSVGAQRFVKLCRERWPS